MKKLVLVSLLIACSSLLFVGCNNPDSAIQIDGNSKITINIDKAIDNVDGFFQGLVDKIAIPVANQTL